MKRVIAVVVAVVLAGCAAEAELNKTPAVTPKGETTGAAKTALIGAAGGTLSSADGALSLIVPAGALSADTTLSITPLSVKAPGGIVAYRIGPEGTTFATPASIKITATEAQLNGTEMPALRIAYQDTAGSWRAFTDGTIDGRSITVKTKHLSDWSLLTGWQLRPPRASVDVNKTVTLTVRFCNTTTSDPGTDGELVGLVSECQEDEGIAPLVGTWAVNGTPNGNASIGTIAPGSPSGTYTAPATKPSSNPVAVSVEFNPQGRGKTLLTSSITVGADLPRQYAGTFTLYEKRGNTDAFVEYTASGMVSFTAKANVVGDYDLTNGTVSTVDVNVKAGNCTCNGRGSSALDDGTLRIDSADSQVTFDWSTPSFEIPINCTKIDPTLTPPCPATHAAALSWEIPGNDPGNTVCPTTSDEIFTDVRNIVGSSSMTCSTITSDVRGTWSLIGSD